MGEGMEDGNQASELFLRQTCVDVLVLARVVENIAASADDFVQRLRFEEARDILENIEPHLRELTRLFERLH